MKGIYGFLVCSFYVVYYKNTGHAFKFTNLNSLKYSIFQVSILIQLYYPVHNTSLEHTKSRTKINKKQPGICCRSFKMLLKHMH